MGPRSVDRGISALDWVDGIYDTLQWGRDQLIAEFRSRKTSGSGPRTGFNGAAIS